MAFGTLVILGNHHPPWSQNFPSLLEGLLPAVPAARGGAPPTPGLVAGGWLGGGHSPPRSVSRSCSGAFAGQRCQAPNPCLSAPCKNGGTCHTVERDGLVDYACRCRLGFSGPLCLTPRDHACLASPCLNGGTCDLLTLTEYKCLCPPGWSGEDAGGGRGCGAREGWAGPGLPPAARTADAGPVCVAGEGFARLLGSVIQKWRRAPPRRVPTPLSSPGGPHPCPPL